MLKVFSFGNVGECVGLRLGAIENGWTAGGYAAPNYEVVYGPDRITLTRPLVSAADSTGDRTGKAVDLGGRFSTEATGAARQAIFAIFADADAP